MKNLDIRWLRLVPVWLVAFAGVLVILSMGRGLSTIDGDVEFSNSFADMLKFTLFSGRTGWTILFTLGILALVFVLDKYGDLNLSGKRSAKSAFMLVSIALGIFTFIAFGKMYAAGFSWVILIAFSVPTLVATLAALRKRRTS